MKYICYNWMPTIADHILDIPEKFYKDAGTSRLHDIDNFNPYAVRDDDLIFVKTDFVINGHFFTNFLDKIYCRFNLITGVSSYNIGRDGGDSYKKILNHPNLIKWICTNPPEEKSDKIVPIPIGFQEPDRPGGNQDLLEQIQQQRTPFDEKEDGIFLPYHDLTTNPDRAQLFQALSKLPFVHAQTQKQDLIEYYTSLDKYKFVIGLEGRGPDIHRNYETLLVGAVPISIKNVIQHVFELHQVGGVFLNNWGELDNNLFNSLTETSYNIARNDAFLTLEKHVSHVKGMLKKEQLLNEI